MDYLEQLTGEAEHHGSGSFTSDLSRMQQVLGSHQLADPEEFVLAIVSAAVLNGSSWFRLESARGLLRLHWSEPGLDVDQLHQLLPSLAHPGTMLSELAIGLLAARRLGAVSLQAPGGLVYFDGEHLIVSDHCGEGNCLTLERRSWWQRLWKGTRPTASLLKLRARHAPLQVSPQPRNPQVAVGLALGTSNLPAHPISAHEWVELPPNPWGEGIVYFAHSDWQLIRHGVSYLIPAPIPGVTALWWSDRLPLDLSRQYVVQGPEFKQWTAWLHDQLSELVLQRGLRQHFATLIASSRPSQLPTLLEAPIFRRADGNIACLRQIREEYLEHGWLPVVSYAMQIEWEPQRVLIVDHPHEKQLCTLFSNWINLDHLQGQINLPRLPNPEDYLVRMPLRSGRGEAGLRRYLTFFGFREYVDGSWQERRGLPFGLDAAREGTSGQLPMGELFWTIKIMKLADTWEPLRQQYLLQMLAWLRAILVKQLQKRFARQHPLEVLLDPKSQVQLHHRRGTIGATQLQEIAGGLILRLHSGASRPLNRLTESTRYFSVGCWNGSNDSLRLSLLEMAAIQPLFLPGTFQEKSSSPGVVWATEAAMLLLSDVQSGEQLLARFLVYRECAAYKILRAVGLSDLPGGSASVEIGEVVRRALWELHSSDRGLNTAYLLLVLAEDPDLGLDRDALLPWMIEWGEWESQQHLTLLSQVVESEADAGLAVSYRYALAWSYLHVRRFEQARDICRHLLSQGPLQAQASMTLGLIECLAGDLAAGLVHFRQAHSKEPDATNATCIAETLMWLGRLDEARAALPDSQEQYTLMIRASLAETPEEQLRLADLTEQAGTGQYFELAELRGQAYHKLGKYEEARQHLSRFLEARLDNSLLDLFEERQQRARQLLQDCEGR